MKRALIYLTLLILPVVGCTSSNYEGNFKFGIGKYKFTMKDSLGNKIAEGTLNVDTLNGNDISGKYEFTKIYQNDFPGMSTMNGEFGGNILKKEKRVFINTNPKIADSNVFWNLDVKEKYLSGQWTYSTFRGKQTKGKIKIAK